jgi:hypothetical protein
MSFSIAAANLVAVPNDYQQTQRKEPSHERIQETNSKNMLSYLPQSAIKPKSSTTGKRLNSEL